MPRSNRPRVPRDRRGRPARAPEPTEEGAREGAGDVERALRGMERRETHGGEEWMVRHVTGAGSSKTYRCPHCTHEITPGTPHVVAWRVDAPGSWIGGGDVALRRHWHTGCWTRRRPGAL